MVLNWCDADATTTCIESLAGSRYPDLSLLVVDNGSPDRSGEVLQRRHPEVPFLQTGANLGYTGGNNRGIAHALQTGADYVFVVNNDTWVHPDAMGILVDAARSRPRVGAVAPTIVRMDAPHRLWYGGGAFDVKRALGIHWNGTISTDGALPPAASTPARPVTFFTGCAVLLDGAALRAVGAFEESYFLYVEDAELSVRLVRSGWEILHAPEARVEHRVEAEGRDPEPYQIRFRDRNRRRLARTHFTAMERLAFAAWFYPTRLVHLIRYLALGDVRRAGAIVRGMGER